MLIETNKRHDLRAAIDSQLRSDQDLDAFFVDFFPEVYLRFGSGMQRAAKVNLLFTLVEVQEIARKLRLCTEPGQRLVTRRRWQKLQWGLAITVLAGIASGFLALHRGWQFAFLPVALHSSPASAPFRVSPARSANSGNAIIDSIGAQMRNLVDEKPAGAHWNFYAPNNGNRIEGSASAVMHNEVKSQ